MQTVLRLQAEQARLASEIERLQKARVTYIDNLPELAQQAGDLFAKQPPHEKRKLLRYVVTECKWAKGALVPVQAAVRGGEGGERAA